ncbi:hypothetical protein HaLaN_30716 [Haematococcus lacustris]|uniref:Uncharacterized protein n=1 Tax=Haematococcus lacustris TaxID=44745 RepID=A0A6A0AG69_HAELA|nr:hypothetical protein HaLaN_30716 [Haematococcus lacustris]
MQRIGESKWRPLELCYWPEQGKLPAKGKEYRDLGYKRRSLVFPLVATTGPAQMEALVKDKGAETRSVPAPSARSCRSVCLACNV